MGTPVNSTTTSGPVTYANESAVMITWSAIPSRSAGPDTAGPSSRSTIGTTPDASDSALATRPQACSAATPSLTSAPELATRPTIGIPSSTARRTARSIVWPFGGADRAAVLAAVEVEPAHRPAVEIPERRLDCLAPVPEDGRRRRGLGHSAEG